MDFNILNEMMNDFHKKEIILSLHKETSEADDFILREYEYEYIKSRGEIREYIFNNSIIGMAVKKKSNKPFKSGLKINTIKLVTINNNSKKPGFKFYEDDSCVDMCQCEII